MNSHTCHQSTTLLVNGRWLDPERMEFCAGEISFADGQITAIGAPGTLPREGATLIDVRGALIAPGLVDIHSHGRAGGDFVSADVALLQKMSVSYLQAGVTTVMPTLASAPFEEYAPAACRIRQASATADGARLLGLHLEGRYLNPKKRGAHASHLLAPLRADELSALHDTLIPTDGSPFPLRLSAALELDADGAFLSQAQQLGIALSLGHTEANYTQARELIAHGVGCFTHLFNAMPPLHHRDGGAVAACLEGDAYGELICDGFHIAPHMIRLAYRLLGRDRTVLISDSMEGTGCPDGNYSIAGMDVTVKDGKAYTSDGAIAGSTLGLLEGVNNLMQFCSLSPADALICATRNPARAAHIDHLVGLLRVGAAADLLILDHEHHTLKLRDIYVNGISKGGMIS